MKLVVGLPLSPVLDNDLSLLRGTLENVTWPSLHHNFLIFSKLNDITDRYTLAELDHALSKITWAPFSIHFQHVFHRIDSHEDRITTRAFPAEPLIHLQKKIDNCLNKLGCHSPHHVFYPEITLGFLPGGQFERITPWIQRHNLFHTQSLTVHQFVLLEEVKHHHDIFFQHLEIYEHHGQKYYHPINDES